MDKETAARYAPVVLRIALSLLFLWFGISQLVNPESFLGYIPDWMYTHGAEMTHSHPLQMMHNIPKPSVHVLIMGNGLFETVFGTLLLLGLFTRISAILLSLHLFIIAIGMGYNDITVRDLALAFASISVALYGPDSKSLDNRRKKDKKEKER
ncbi:DoxX family membrane protein [Candidatus Woesearchaeota archaeon]|nr:MAG: hypothetical protein QS99_C0001G0122 [archaeon GW2011_AR4]MBS3129333.1 DoxX family membrane protein [Candidatus Woesearchaeota archaeon]HIH38636.1 DoxX family membrane protein [Candidatus Woesearchaeota archaeon]HIH49425.1 DoxX family membrane protein [Candidatus Woesearchaeota archaeon]HIJ02840.1 DoxX family membrane protein [Candidatus Woesearchaeota archaeon]